MVKLTILAAALAALMATSIPAFADTICYRQSDGSVRCYDSRENQWSGSGQWGNYGNN